MSNDEHEIWAFLRRHLESVFTRDTEAYRETTSQELSLYEWFVSPHRQDGLDFHLFMIEQGWSGAADSWRFDLLEPRLQRYGSTAIASYTFMLTTAQGGVIRHRLHNESRVMVRFDDGWKVVHVHKSPARPDSDGQSGGPS